VDWRLGPHGEHPASTTTLDTDGPPHRRRLVASALLLTLYGLALVAAALAGFAIGRWSTGRRSYEAAIQNQLAVESFAWRTGDESLLLTGVDPNADRAYVSELVAQFRRLAPADVSIAASGFRALASDRVAVDVMLGLPGQPEASTMRQYVRIDGRWYRTADEASAEGASASDVALPAR
jgi:hypothetical protein